MMIKFLKRIKIYYSYFFILLVLFLGSYFILFSHKAEESSLSQVDKKSSLSQNGAAELVRPVNPLHQEMMKVLSSKDWNKMKDYLDKNSTEEMSLTQILRYVEKENLGSTDQEALFNLVFSYCQKSALLPRNRVLAFRIFSNFNLTLDQQTKIRGYFKEDKNERFKEDLLYHSFVSSVPFPKDFQGKINSDFRSQKNPSKCVENLYIFGVMKDLKAKEEINRNMVKLFPKVHKSCQPALAKYLMNNASDAIKTQKAYQKIVRVMSSEDFEGYEK